MKKVSQLKDGDVIPCNRCGDLVTLNEFQESKDKASMIHPDVPLDTLVVICNDCMDELNNASTVDLNNQSN